MINLVHVFEEQEKLNKETAEKHEEYSLLTRDELTRNYAFSSLCELGEMANEWAQFKIWKSSRKENRDAACKKCDGRGLIGIIEIEECPYCERGRVNPLREEYIDVVHFTISVALGFDLNPEEYLSSYQPQEVSVKDSYKLYLELYKNLVYANILIDELEDYPNTEKLLRDNRKERTKVATELLDVLFKLGYSLDFSDRDIEQAYFAKHKVNQVRQANNY